MRTCVVIVLAVALAGLARTTAEAQIVVVPRYRVTTPVYGEYLQWLDVEATPDGDVLYLWGEAGSKDRVVAQRFATDGVALGVPVRVDESGETRDVALAPDGHGGFVAAYRHSASPEEVQGRYLSALGVPIGAAFSATCAPGFVSFFALDVAGLSSGAAFLYSQTGLKVCLVDGSGTLRAAVSTIDEPSEAGAVVARADGGFLFGWWESGTGSSYVRAHDADSQPLADALPILNGGGVSHLVRGPTGMIVAVGSSYDGAAFTSRVWAQRVADDGAPLAPAFVVDETAPGLFAIDPVAALDASNNLYVAWSEFHPYDGPPASPKARARAVGPDDAPYGPAFVLDGYPSPQSDVRVVALPDGTFLNAWIRNHEVHASVLSLCTPGVAVCGDGVLMPACEVCDDGPANSDSVPDACRTNCRPPRCGDQVTDGNEQCDDGNTLSCDGCSATCASESGLVCGDGVVAAGCGETCDDGNAVTGDGCDAACALERIPGKGSLRTECWSEWSVDNPANEPFRDARGAVNYEQTCGDGDPRCDFDGGQVGSCTFHVRVCINNTDIPGCTPPSRLASWALTSPSSTKALRDPSLAIVRAGFAGILGALVGPSARDACSPIVDIPVPVRVGPRPGRLKLKARAESYEGQHDADQLKLECVP